MSTRMEAGLRTLVLALYDEAALTAAAKGLTGTLGQLAALRETASLASGPARRWVSEEEVMRILLSARRTRRGIRLPTTAALSAPSPNRASSGSVSSGTATLDQAPVSSPSFRLRRGRLAARAMRSLARHTPAALI